jgi:acetate kinase
MSFWDGSEYKPSEFYFIAIIDGQIEIRTINGAKKIEWYNMPESHTQVNDAKVIKKIEKTIETMLKKLSKMRKIKGIKLNKKTLENLCVILNIDTQYADTIAEIAYSPADYFDRNRDQLKKYEIPGASENMYLGKL